MWQLLLDLTQIVSQISSVLISAVGLWIAYQTFLRTPEQRVVSPSAQRKKHGTNEEKVKPNLIVFKSSNQTTTLSINSGQLECHLTDKRPGKNSGVQWIISKQEIGKIISDCDFNVSPGLKINTGLFSIGPRRNWLYTKRLFPDPGDLEHQIGTLLNEAVQN